MVIVLWLLVPVGMYAQNDLRINDVFEHYAKRHGSTMVQLSEDVLRAYEMTFYKSLSFRPERSGNYSFNWILTCIDSDKRHAKKIKETLLDGELKSGYYQLPQARKGINRFILFNTKQKEKATLIYIEGTLSSAELVTMLFSKK
jgi:hypothetical protein